MQGAKFGATAGRWTGAPTSFQYPWSRCDPVTTACAVVRDWRPGSNYYPAAGDVGQRLKVEVMASNAVGSWTAASDLSDVVQAPPA